MGLERHATSIALDLALACSNGVTIAQSSPILVPWPDVVNRHRTRAFATHPSFDTQGMATTHVAHIAPALGICATHIHQRLVQHVIAHA